MRRPSSIKALMWVFVATASIFTGCTKLITYKLTDERGEIPAGTFPYSLQKSTVKLTTKAVLTSCEPQNATAKNPNFIGISISSILENDIVEDEKEKYFVDYEQLQSLWKTTNLTIKKSKNNTIQSATMDVSDKSLEIAAAAIGAVAKVAVLTRRDATVPIVDWGISTPPIQETTPPSSSACSKDAYDKLLDAKNKKKILDDLTSQVSAPPSGASDAKTTNVAITKAVENYNDALEKITINNTIYITLNRSAELKSLNDSCKSGFCVIKKRVEFANIFKGTWIKNTLDIKDVGISYNGRGVIKGDSAGSLDFILSAISVPSGTEIDKEEEFKRKANNHGEIPYEGLVLRVPAVGRAQACIPDCQIDLPATIPAQSDPRIQLSDVLPISVPQLGKKVRFPLKNGIGQDSKLVLTSEDDGSLSQLELGSVSNVASGINGFGTAVTAYTTAVAARNADRTAQASLSLSNAQYPDQALKAQADCLAQQAAVVQAGAAPVVTCK